MTLRNSAQTYGSVAKTLHWLIFLLIASLIAVGFIMTGMPNGPDKFKLIGLHKSIGITVLMVATLRVMWKLANVAPALPDTMTKMEKFLAHAGHLALYALMFLMPLSGWVMSSAAGFSVSVFGWFTMPNLVAPDKELLSVMRERHDQLAWIIIIMVLLHVLAALLHHFYYKDNVLVRMLPWGQKHAPNSDRTTR